MKKIILTAILAGSAAGSFSLPFFAGESPVSLLPVKYQGHPAIRMPLIGIRGASAYFFFDVSMILRASS